jgi:hypothetical protein
MSTRDAKPRKSDTAAKEVAHAFYVYCIGESEFLAPLFECELPEAIESEAGLDLVVNDPLAAIVSAVPKAAYAEENLHERLGDPAWMALRAMRHEKVIEHFAVRATLVPLRFGSIYLERQRITSMLSEKREGLVDILNRVRGREEWGVNIIRDRGRLMEAIESVSPRLREVAARAAAASPGESYLLRKKIDALRSEEAGAEVKRVIALIEGKLKTASDGALRLAVLKEETAMQGDVVARLAFLVPRSEFTGFRETAERLAEEHAQAGFKLEFTGPWPAYNFTVGEL